MPENIHATAISIDGHGVLLMGRSGSGKSDLALRMIDRGAVLISDDRVIVLEVAGIPVLQAAQNIAGLIEIRGVAIASVPFVTGVTLRLIVDLDADAPRYCDGPAKLQIAGFAIPKYAIAAFESSAPLKLEYALKSVLDKSGTAETSAFKDPKAQYDTE
jgi:HPr kinase/phosphorylase